MLQNFNIQKTNIIKKEYKNIMYKEAVRNEQYILVQYLKYIKAIYCNIGLRIAAGLNNMRMVKFLMSNNAIIRKKTIKDAAKK